MCTSQSCQISYNRLSEKVLVQKLGLCWAGLDLEGTASGAYRNNILSCCCGCSLFSEWMAGVQVWRINCKVWLSPSAFWFFLLSSIPICWQEVILSSYNFLIRVTCWKLVSRERLALLQSRNGYESKCLWLFHLLLCHFCLYQRCGKQSPEEGWGCSFLPVFSQVI